MTMVTLAVILGLTFVVALYAGRQYREEIKPYWDPAVDVFTVLRFVGVALIAYGLWVSGRVVLQLIAVVIVALGGLYVAIERPTITDSSDSNA